MEIAELKANVHAHIERTQDSGLLELVSDLFEEAAQGNASIAEKEALLASALEGRAEIANGQYGSLADLDKAMYDGMQAGLARRNGAL